MKKKFTIAIFSDFKFKSGGAYNEAHYLAERIFDISKKNFDLFMVNNSVLSRFNIEKNIKLLNFQMNLFDRFICYSRNFNPLIKKIKRVFFQNKLEKFLKKNNIDLIIFTGPSQYSLYLEETDFIITIPDIGHLENNEFPEWAKNGEFDRREKILVNSKKAFLILTNAKIIAKKLIDKYNYEDSRVKVISQTVPVGLKNLDTNIDFKSFNLPENYIFYPAMYLPHKNHKYVIDTIKQLKINNQLKIGAVFCGDDKGYLNNLKSYVNKLGLKQEICFFDFVSYEQLAYLYKNSYALIMPTFSGPTNIPPWEAFYFKKPVFYSNIFNIDKEYKDSVIYIDPFDEKTLIDGLIMLSENPTLYQDLCARGNKMIAENEFDNQITALVNEIKKLEKIKNSWKLDNDI